MLRLETEEEIRQMLYDIVVGGEIWEYMILECPEDCKSVHSGCAFDCEIKNKWRTYKLGEAINPRYAYMKVDKQLYKDKKILDKRAKVCYNKSMKRIDVLKGIKQILVQKAYDTGHISHRADGDWQKQADGSWKPYKGQSTSQTQEPAPTENTECGEITEEDLVETPSDTIYSNEDKEKSVVNPKMYWDGISMSSVDKPVQYILENLEDFEGEDMDGTIKTFVKGAGNREQQIIDTIKRYIQRQAESDGKRLTWYSDGTYSIEKSAFRDMRSIPVTKNMGF